MSLPHILALDFDGVLCDGMQEYFEASRRTYTCIWPDAPAPGDDLLPAFQGLRPVIMTGWEMPLLLRALVQGYQPSLLLRHWDAVRDTLVQADAAPDKPLSATLAHALDDVRCAWIAATPEDWLARHIPYCPLDDLRRLLAEPAYTALVTTKEGAFARQILDHWGVHVADIQGKETGTHKCDNLRALIARYTATHGQRPVLWFVEDRLETLQHVTTHADLDDVGLFLAAWGYNTPETRLSVQDHGRIRLLTLAQFRHGLHAWR